jgi:alpha-L-fucosidase 2
MAMRSRFLAGVFAFALGLAAVCAQPPGSAPSAAAPVPSAAPPGIAVNWPAFLGRQDLVWPDYPTKWENAPFIGNGNLGAYIRADNGGALAWEVNRTDITHDGLRYGMGRLAVQVAGGVESNGETRLDLWNAEVRGSVKTRRGVVQWRSFAVGAPSVIVLELKGIKVETGTEVVWLPALARPPHAGKRTDGYPPEALHPSPLVHTVVDGVTSTQTFLGGGAYAVVLRRIFSSLDRKVYVLSVDRGDTAKRALSEAELAAERAASLGLPGLLAVHRGWWHSYYGLSFLSVPDARLEAFYWIQVYKLGSALRSGGPLVDATGPWYRPNAPAAGNPAAASRELAQAYSPIFAANRLTLGDTLFSIDLKASKPAADLSVVSQLAWQYYRSGMDEGVLNYRVVPLLARASEAPGADPGFVRWALQTVIRAVERQNSADPRLKLWQSRLAALPPGGGGLRSPQLLRPDRPADRKLIEAAIRAREAKPSPAAARGYGEAASLHARLGQGGPALDDLNSLVSRHIRPNTFFSASGVSTGVPLSAANAIQDLLLQSWGNRIRVFPAMPPGWKDAAFSTLRADGGFLVSGVWRDGAPLWIRVEATAPGICRVLVPGWTQALVRAARRPEITAAPGDLPGEYVLNLGGKGGWAVLAPAPGTPLPPVAPLAKLAGASDNPYPPRSAP